MGAMHEVALISRQGLCFVWPGIGPPKKREKDNNNNLLAGWLATWTA